MLLIVINFMNNPKTTLDKVTDQLVGGFVFGIKIFAVIIPIAAFFYMGEMVEYDDTKTIFTNPHKEATQNYITGRFG